MSMRPWASISTVQPLAALAAKQIFERRLDQPHGQHAVDAVPHHRPLADQSAAAAGQLAQAGGWPRRAARPRGRKSQRSSWASTWASTLSVLTLAWAIALVAMGLETTTWPRAAAVRPPRPSSWWWPPRPLGRRAAGSSWRKLPGCGGSSRSVRGGPLGRAGSMMQASTTRLWTSRPT